MRLATLCWLLGTVWSALGLLMAAPLLVALGRGEAWAPFAVAMAVALGAGAGMILAARGRHRGLDHRSAFLTVAAAWTSACALGSIPFRLHPDVALTGVDAWFESVSGFTTTGATVLSGLDHLPRSLLLWRSLCQWLGGMGIVVFGVALLPLLGVGGMALYKAEAPGPTKDKLSPRIAETARLLWALYLGLSVAAAVAYGLAGMPAFHAVCHAMTTIATGGFSTHDASLGFYDSSAVHVVAILGMLVGGTSFAILHRALTGDVRWSDQPELRTYVGLFLVAMALITADLLVNRADDFASVAESLQHAAFQVASVLSSTGYSTRDWDTWSAPSRVTLFLLFFVGGMAGSTAGGVKVIRVLLLVRLAFAQFFRLVHPHAFSVIRLGGRTVSDDILLSSIGFVGMWIMLVGAGAALLSLNGLDALSSLAAAAVALGNVGPGLGDVAPSRTYAPLTSAAKLILTALMVLGRLEIYALLILLTPGFWRR